MQNILFGIRSRTFFILLSVFLICTFIAMSQLTLESEKQFMNDIQKSAGNPSIDYAVWLLTESGNVFVMLPFSIILLIIRKTRRIGMILLILLVLSSILTGYIKCGVDRDRPFLDWLGNELPFEVEPDSFSLFCEGRSWTAGFPSGHAARSAMFAFVMVYVLSEKFPRGVHLIWLYPILMSFSRIYVLQHYPLDVIGGFILGIFLAGYVSKRLKLDEIFLPRKI
ncbi:MAG: phosphatase PAP2 family protein [Thaumarchaeota archaeon]|nr:phosphatase PAP2 family protein [Nitrososphaerota archaeon]MBT3743858.1 phosphatase PAP2 family protein [Nitrososphaerota archaeon]MBT4057821.1 phosphatase PAP2 family protein [Nitrososphaerota archaeon]MBT4176533.1 phosphatase PAP2 family protein [Nitrososphaerota archaeon]MBT4510098.1 phosphatase PAP2 family protein [Nitrososphaerota archaeon]